MIQLKFDIYQIVYILVLFFISIIRIYFGKHRLKSNYKISVNPLIERINSYLFSISFIFFPLMNVFLSYFERFRIEIPIPIKIFSSFILIIGTVLFYLSHKELADNWSPFLEIKDRQKLIKTGIYKYIRHPMYLSMWIYAIFLGLVLSNIFIEFCGIVTWANLYFIRISNEEKMMLDTFGEEYKEYIKNTGRLLPKITKSKNL